MALQAEHHEKASQAKQIEKIKSELTSWKEKYDKAEKLRTQQFNEI
jgi:flagellar capping protein FliD